MDSDRRWPCGGATLVLVAFVVAALSAACGSSDPPATAESARSATVTAPAADELASPGVERMGPVEAGTARSALPQPTTPGVADPAFMRAAFDSAQEMWQGEFARASLTYRPAGLVFFGEQVASACGIQSREVGPFYCPADETAYLNTEFFSALARAYRLRSGFAAGYITAHEVGHHVQHLLGLLNRVAAVDARDPGGANQRSVSTELQADCYAGMWLHTVAGRDELKTGDLEDIVRAAAVVGDDYQQQRATGMLTPETWTHGSSAQRVNWLGVGLREGDPAACDVFAAGH